MQNQMIVIVSIIFSVGILVGIICFEKWLTGEFSGRCFHNMDDLLGSASYFNDRGLFYFCKKCNRYLHRYISHLGFTQTSILEGAIVRKMNKEYKKLPVNI